MGGACAIVLAAGAGRRAGGPKADYEMGGRRLVDRAVDTARAGGCSPVIAVVRPGTEVPGAQVIVNLDPDRGLSSSLRLGFAAADATDCDRAVVLLIDEPGITPAAVCRMRTAPGPVGAMWFATYNGRRGHPVRIDRDRWDDVAHGATGDTGAKSFADNITMLVRDVDCSGLCDPRDLDTERELRVWRDAHAADLELD